MPDRWPYSKGTVVISEQMDPNFVPPSGSLNPAATVVMLDVDPAVRSGRYLVVDLPGGGIPLPGDQLPVRCVRTGSLGQGRVGCVDLIERRLYLAVTWSERGGDP